MATTETRPELHDVRDPWGEIARDRKRRTVRRKAKIAAAALALVLAAAGVTAGVTAAALNGARDGAGEALSRAEALYGPRRETAIKLVGYLIKSPPLERDTIDPLIMAANMASVNTPDAGGTGKKFAQYATAQADMESALRQLKTTTDHHPDLQANKGFTDAMRTVDAAAPDVAAAQGAYNEAAGRYNDLRDGFPGNLLAPLLGHDTPWGTFTAP